MLAAPPSHREVVERLTNVEDDVEFLNKRIDKIQGRQTGGVRSKVAEEFPPGLSPGQLAWLQSLDPISRKIHIERMKGGNGGVLRRPG